MKIAVLAWGSLVWDRRGLVIAEDFRPVGPLVPVELSRVSRDGRLTLVLDEAFGAPCLTYSAMSVFGDINETIENLRRREGMPGGKGVGFFDVA